MASSFKSLPDFISPMLPKQGEPFDSDEHIFEVKWDGMRTLAFVDRDGYRLRNRRRTDVTDGYPEFDFLGSVAAGTVLDGEIVVLRDGKPDFNLLQKRLHIDSRSRAEVAARTHPATYIVFDQLYGQFSSLIEKPLESRREVLRSTVDACEDSRLVLSEGAVGRAAGRSTPRPARRSSKASWPSVSGAGTSPDDEATRG